MILTIDYIDVQILTILQVDGKISNLKLAEKISFSPAATLERVRKLELQGFIESYHAQLNPSKLALQVNLWLEIKLTAPTKENINTLQQAINKMPEVATCYHVIGHADFLLNIYTKDIAAYKQLLINKLGAIPAIQSIQTMTVLSTCKDSGLPVLK